MLPVAAVCDLRVYSNVDVSMAVHVRATARTSFAALRQIRVRSERRSLSRETLFLLSLIRALVVSKLDYCNSVLVGVQRRLQSVSNAASQPVFSARS